MSPAPGIDRGRSAGEAPGSRPGLLVEGAREIVTMAGGLRRGAAQGQAASLSASDGGLEVACWEGRFVLAGRRDDVARRLAADGLDPADGARFACLDVAGGTVTPGLIDPHTHLVFAGSRENEIELRRRGATYLEILAAGGGILSTVAATRRASVDDLTASGHRWLREMLRHGATTVEAKSGYGLERDAELRQLEAIGRLDAEGPTELVPTFLGAHAVAPEFRDRPDATDAYVRDVIDVQLPAVAAQGIARFCDVFCEQGVFTAEQSRRVLLAGARLGLGLRLHADELRPSGGAELAAELGAAAADHLGVPSPAGIDALAGVADAGTPVVATLLPATSLFLKGDEYGPARELIDRGVPVALGTDFNPGTSPAPNLQLVLSLAVLRMGLTPLEALAGVTVNAAHALRLGDSHGTIEPGRQADLVAWDVPGIGQIPYWLGAGLVRAVVKRGRVVAFD
ncbi:MAG TPA: imidazolonepropionase [Candidatus Acidoferrales bacterium]|nr:imidazolonepropionase [Candidatus Acidoferrales bacterium]